MKIKEDKSAAATWIKQWLPSVANGAFTMSQHKLSSVYKRDIKLNNAIKKAKKYKVCWLLLKDDKGEKLVAASKMCLLFYIMMYYI